MRSGGNRQSDILVSKWFHWILVLMFVFTASGFPAESVSAQTCLGEWDVWGLSGVSSRYSPGASISGSLSYKISNNSDSPGAVAQVLVGLVDDYGHPIDVTCIYDGNPRTCPDYTTGSGHFILTAPSNPGSYRLIAAMDRHYSCSHAAAQFPIQGDQEHLATIEVDGEQPCVGEWDVWGLSGVSSRYSPGASISGSLSYKISNNSDSPGAVAQVLVGLVDDYGHPIDVTCIYDGNPRTCPDYTTGSGHFILTAPSNPGSYRLIAAMDRHYSCSHAKSNFPNQGDQERLTTISVDGGPQYYQLTIRTSGGGNTNPSPGAHEYKKGSRVTITADPDPACEFDHWSGDASGTSSSTTITMDEDKRVYAYFECDGEDCKLTIRAREGGDTDPSPGTYPYKCGTRVTITAKPDPGCHFDHWSGDASGTSTSKAMTIDEDKTVYAYFECEPDDCKLTIRAREGGDTDPSPGTHKYKKGTRVTITAKPDPGCHFDHWSGDASGTSTSKAMTIDEDKTVYAYFECEPDDCKLTIRARDGGTTGPSPGTHTYDCASRVTIRAYPDSDCEFDHWSGDASGTSSSVTITVDEDKTVYAYFDCEPANEVLSLEPPYKTSKSEGKETGFLGAIKAFSLADAFWDGTGICSTISTTFAWQKCVTTSAISFHKAWTAPQSGSQKVECALKLKGDIDLNRLALLAGNSGARGDVLVQYYIFDRELGTICSEGSQLIYSGQRPPDLKKELKGNIAEAVALSIAKLALIGYAPEALEAFKTAVELGEVSAAAKTTSDRVLRDQWNTVVTIESGQFRVTEGNEYGLTLYVYCSSKAAALTAGGASAMTSTTVRINSIKVIPVERR